jgi:hypothetical protein
MKIRAIAGWAFVATLFMFAGGCGSSGVDPNLPAITTQPANVTTKVGTTATFTVVATGQAPLSYQWFVFAKQIAGATSPSYTTGTLAASDNNSFYFCLITNSLGSIETNEALLTVTTTSPNPGVTANTLGNANPADVLTLHNDAARTGQYLGETLLTPANVNSTKFGKLATLITDGQVDAQPLYASGVTLPTGDVQNILYAATEHGSVYAFDVTSGSVIWQTGLSGANEQPADSGTCSDKPQESGITATPVIDRTRGPHGAIYVIANTKDSAGTSIQRIHALDIATGTELFSGPTLIQASAGAANNQDSGAQRNFDAAQYRTISGLQLVNGKVFASWSPECSAPVDSGWVIGFDAASLNPVGSIYLAPAGGPNAPGFTLNGLSADLSGNLYVFGQASFAYQAPGSTSAVTPAKGGNAFLKLSTENGLGLVDYSETPAPRSLTLMGSGAATPGGAVVIPDFADASGKVWHLALGSGSDGNIYVLNRDALGGSGLQSTPIIQIVDAGVSTTGANPTIAYFGDTAYYAAGGSAVKTFTVSDARLSTSSINQSGYTMGAAGAQISVSAKGATGGVLWAVENTAAGILHAYDATDISHEMYNSTQATNSRDAFNSAVSAVSPTVAGGKVFVATKNGIVIFGQLK